MANEVILINCKKCKKLYQVSDIECKKVFWYGDILTETYCPYCGHVNQDNVNFKGSGGGKF